MEAVWKAIGGRRAEMRAGQEALRAEMKEGQEALWKAIDGLRAEMRAGQEAPRAEREGGQAALPPAPTPDKTDPESGRRFGIGTCLAAPQRAMSQFLTSMRAPDMEEVNGKSHIHNPVGGAYPHP